MRAAAVICECNPLHEGHRFLFSRMRERADCVAAILSGNFVQRGEAACFDSYTRAQALLAAGADLVVSLPYPYSAASAAFFASAGVSVAAGIGAQKLCFGATSDDAAHYLRIGEALCGAAFAARFSAAARGGGAAASREMILRELLEAEDQAYLRAPNDILAGEYCAAIRRQNAPLVPQAILRRDAAQDARCIGATALRKILFEKGFAAAAPYFPPGTAEIFRAAWAEGRYAPPERLREILYLHLRLAREQDGASFAECGGGVWERLRAAAQESQGGEETFSRAAARQFTNARLRRAALFALLETTADALSSPPAYTLLLAANPTGRAYLAENRRRFSMAVLTKPADPPPDSAAAEQYAAARSADRLYTLCLAVRREAGYYLRQTPFMQS